VYEYPHPIEIVWRAISEREAISEWLMKTDFEPQVGRKFTLTDPTRRVGAVASSLRCWEWTSPAGSRRWATPAPSR